MRVTDYIKQLQHGILYREWEVKETQQQENDSLLSKIHLKIILWKVRRKFSKRNPPENYFNEYLYRFHYLTPTSYYVINKLKEERFQVYFYIITENPKTECQRKYLLHAITLPKP